MGRAMESSAVRGDRATSPRMEGDPRSDRQIPADKAPEQIARMFDAIASRYDLLNHLLSAGLDRAWRARVVTTLALSGTETLLDLCTGTGDLALAAVARRNGARRVIGIDFAPEMLRRGRVKIRERGLDDRIRLVLGDATQVPLPDASVDAVTMAFGIRNVQEPEKALGEVHRVLRPGGRVVILEFGEPRPRLLRSVYLWYFRRVLPWIGRAVSGHASAYTYLPSSVGTFFSPTAFCGLLRTGGFSEVHAVQLSLGIVYQYDGLKS